MHHSSDVMGGSCVQGELRPQLLDRFGLSVNVATIPDTDTRAKMVMDRLAYEQVGDESHLEWPFVVAGQSPVRPLGSLLPQRIMTDFFNIWIVLDPNFGCVTALTCKRNHT